jgi:hypothetical protein
MAKRHADAIAIQGGAVNPTAIVGSINTAIMEIRKGFGNQLPPTEAVARDPAVQLMVHQLAFVCGIGAFDDLDAYEAAVVECESKKDER